MAAGAFFAAFLAGAFFAAAFFAAAFLAGVGVSSVPSADSAALAALAALVALVTVAFAARAFASVASKGVAIVPYGITRVTANGEVIYQHQADTSRVLVAPYVAAEMTDLLQTAVNTGTGREAQIGRPVAGKTGTTTSLKDGWFLGFSSGLPLALTAGALQAWLTVEGISIKTIGYFALVGLPYTFKFVWAPLADRFEPPVLRGRRRSWLLLTQLGLAALCFVMATLDPRVSALAVGGCAVAIAFLSASQDIVFDAYRTDLLEDGERRRLLAEHGKMARDYPDVRANTVSSFALGDYEWLLAFEAPELHRIVDLMRELRATDARRHTREETPFFTGPWVPVEQLVNALP